MVGHVGCAPSQGTDRHSDRCFFHSGMENDERPSCCARIKIVIVVGDIVTYSRVRHRYTEVPQREIESGGDVRRQERQTE